MYVGGVEVILVSLAPMFRPLGWKRIDLYYLLVPHDKEFPISANVLVFQLT